MYNQEVIYVQFVLSSEAVARARNIIARTKNVQDAPDQMHFGNMFGYKLPQEDTGSLSYGKGYMSYRGTRDDLHQHAKRLIEEVAGMPIEKIDRAEGSPCQLIKYKSSNRDWFWNHTVEANLRRLIKQGKMQPWALFKQFRKSEPWEVHGAVISVLDSYYGKAAGIPKAGTPEFSRAAASGDMEKFKANAEVQSWLKRMKS